MSPRHSQPNRYVARNLYANPIYIRVLHRVCLRTRVQKSYLACDYVAFPGFPRAGAQIDATNCLPSGTLPRRHPAVESRATDAKSAGKMQFN